MMGLSEERSLRKKGGYATRIARSQFGCCSQHKEREDQLRRTKRDIRTRVAKCVEVDGGIFEDLLSTVPNFSFSYNKFAI